MTGPEPEWRRDEWRRDEWRLPLPGGRAPAWVGAERSGGGLSGGFGGGGPGAGPLGTICMQKPSELYAETVRNRPKRFASGRLCRRSRVGALAMTAMARTRAR